MKIERVNDSQIRCTLSNFDLSERNLNLSELAYGTEKARRLFREMVQKAYDEVGFDAEDIPLMVEAIPLSNESIMLVITKVDDPEEVDTRFSKFVPAPEGDFPDLRGETADPGLEGGETFTALRDADSEAPKRARTRVYQFSSLDKVIEAAGNVGGTENISDTLYKNPEDGSFYLVLTDVSGGTEAFSSVCNQLSEYGTRVRETYSSPSFYEEHYELILKKRALERLAKI
ncbi:MAG: adaptor protein MecA [Stomatobaculum sp.]|nr:adaptor protein MecA [Stomatobaculum sp.]